MAMIEEDIQDSHTEDNFNQVQRDFPINFHILIYFFLIRKSVNAFLKFSLKCI